MGYIVRLHTIPEDQLETLKQYCYDACLNDPTFKFHPIEGENGKIRYIIIECESKDHAFKRGTLFHHKFGCFYEVEWQKEVEK